MKAFVVLVAALVIVVPAAGGDPPTAADSLLALMPGTADLEGWVVSIQPRIYTGEDLYQFIDGGADLFFEYGFRRVIAAEYSHPEGASIDLQVFEMNDPCAAFGIHSLRSGRDARQVAIGQGGSAHDYYLMFWKGPYYVSIASSDTSPECRKALWKCAGFVDGRLKAGGGTPQLVSLLPAQGLLRTEYVRGALGLGAVRLFDRREMFPLLDGAAGSYDDQALLLLRYSDDSTAARRFEAIVSGMDTDERFQRCEASAGMKTFLDKEKRTICLGRSAEYVVVSISAVPRTAEAGCTEIILMLKARGWRNGSP
jgi:hypothetical protein